MSQEFLGRLTDWAVWYKEHENDGADVPTQIKFLKKAIDGCLELLACAAQDLSDLEGRPRESLGKKLWTPSGMRMQGDVRRFG
jgi:hypothetical protein